MSNYGWTNEEGEPIMDGAAYRFEQQLDAESAAERAWERYDEYWGDCDEHGQYDEDDTNERGAPWCYGCDDYASCGEWHPGIGAPAVTWRDEPDSRGEHDPTL